MIKDNFIFTIYSVYEIYRRYGISRAVFGLFSAKRFREQCRYRLPKDFVDKIKPVIVDENSQVILRKDDLREILRSGSYKTNKIYRFIATSGSTGKPMRIPHSKDSYRGLFQSYERFWNLNGLSLWEPHANFFGRKIKDIQNKRPPFWLFSYYTKQLVFSQYHLSKATVSYYLEALVSYKIKWIHGYPSVLYDFSTLIKNEGLTEKVRGLSIKAITTGSETLFSFQEELIKEVFGVEIFDFYGQSEGVAHIYDVGQTKYIDTCFTDVVFLHVEGNLYKILGSTKINDCLDECFYDTGDLAELNDSGTEIIAIVGRNDDSIQLGDGRLVHRLDHILKGVDGIIESKLVQTEIGKAELQIVCNGELSERLRSTIDLSIQEKLGKDFHCSIVKVKKIEKNENGKFRFVESRIKR